MEAIMTMFHHLNRQAKVAQLEVLSSRQKNVLRLDVPVQDAQAVQAHERVQQRRHHLVAADTPAQAPDEQLQMGGIGLAGGPGFTAPSAGGFHSQQLWPEHSCVKFRAAQPV